MLRESSSWKNHQNNKQNNKQNTTMSISSFAPRLFSPSSQSTQESMEDSSSERNASTNNDNNNNNNNNNNNAFLMPGGMNLTTSPTARGNKFIPNVSSSSTNVSLASHHHHAQDRDYGPDMETTRTKSDNGQPITSPSSLDDKDRFSIVGTTATTPRHEGNQDETPPLVATPLEENDMHPPDGESSTSSSNGGTATGGGSGGSSMAGAIFNFTNCIVGAGCIGLGGAFAQSGGAISILSIIVVAWLTKASLDLIIQLSLETPGAHGSYEDLGHVAFGTLGRLVIAASKFLYSFGCLVAYVVVIKDNLAPATFNLLQQGGQCGGHGQGLTLPLLPPLPPFVDPTANRSATEEGSSTTSSSIFWESFCHVLENRLETTWFACIAIILPLCMLRDMTPLASCSAISIGAIVSVMGIILYLFVANPDDAIQQNSHNHNDMADFYVNWLQIRSGYMECIGTFVFTFASQHTAHLVFHSLKMELRTSRHWNKVSLYSLLIACTLSLSIGMGVYMSFGQEARSDIFDIYPSTPLVDVAKLMLSVTMILTFPLPFFTCRELLITILYCPSPQTSFLSSQQQQQQLSTTATQQLSTTAGSNGAGDDDDEEPIRNRVLDDDVDLEDIPPPDEDSVGDGNNEGGSDLEQPLLVQRTSNNGSRTTMSVASDLAVSVQTFLSSSARNWTMVLEDDPKQLKLPYHIALTMKLWLIVVGLAIAAPSLGDVLDLVGCATGTMIAFIVPSCLSFRLRGFSFEAALLFMVGVLVGIVGTLFSLRQLLQDMRLL